MKTLKLTPVLVAISVVALAFTTGCVSEDEFKSLQLQNRTQSERIASLESQLSTAKIEAQQLRKQLKEATGAGRVNVKTREQEIKALEDALAKKNELIAGLQSQLLSSGAKLPIELSVLLQEFAKDNDNMVTFDEKSGSLKFKSDLLFKPGSDVVNAGAAKAIGSLCDILNTEQGKKFDIIVAGHTDDMRIGKPSTKAKHPTNWHLSAHRAISVLNVMSKSKVESTRLSVRGFGEFRPVEPNKPKKKGNPKNRRVEIFIVPKGA